MTDAVAETGIAQALDLTTAGEAPGRVALMPLGEIVAVDGRKWRLDDAAAVIAASLDGRVDLVIDFDHATDRGREAPAAGWIKALTIEAGMLCASVEWTAAGAKALAERSWRYISPTFLTSRDGAVKRIVRAALVNAPAIHALPALATEETPIMSDDITELAAAREEIGKLKTELAAAQAAVPDPARYVPIAAVDALRAELASAEGKLAAHAKAAAEASVETAIADGKLPPALKDWALALAAADPEALKAYIAAAPVIATAAARNGKLPPGGDAGGETPAQIADRARAVIAAAERDGKVITAAEAVRLIEQGAVK